MIRIERVRLPGGMQAFARREDDAVVVYVSAELTASERTAAIARALRAAPEAGWRSPRSPVLLPALAGGARLRLVPESRWAYRGLLATVPVAAAAVVVPLLLLSGGTPVPRDPVAAPQGQPPATSQPARTGDRPAAAHRAGQDPGTGSGPAAARPRSKTKTRGKTTGGGAPVPEGSGKPSPAQTGTNPGSPPPTGNPAPGPQPSPQPSPTPTPSGSGGCVSVLGVTICL
jgi:hypothetical protein